MEYGGFEGIIPSGQYGGGTVMLWIRERGAAAGVIQTSMRDCGMEAMKFVLHGTKLKGKWALIRMGGKG